MSNAHTGGPAFPLSEDILRHPDPRHVMGMTLRDYFAAKAMQGFNANPRYDEYTHEYMAELCYGAADAMLRERAK